MAETVTRICQKCFTLQTLSFFSFASSCNPVKHNITYCNFFLFAAIPVKVTKDLKSHMIPSNGEGSHDKSDKASEIVTHYQYGAYSHSSLTPTFPPTYTTPLPVPASAPVTANTSAATPTVQPSPHVPGPSTAAPPYTSYPPPSHQYTTPQYYQTPSGPPPSRPYYPPPGGQSS